MAGGSKLSREFPSNYSTRVGKCSVCVHKIPSRWWRCFNVFALCVCCVNVHTNTRTHTHPYSMNSKTQSFTHTFAHKRSYIRMPNVIFSLFHSNIIFWTQRACTHIHHCVVLVLVHVCVFYYCYGRMHQYAYCGITYLSVIFRSQFHRNDGWGQ